MMNKPTKEQVIEFWGRIGYHKSFLTDTPYVDLEGHYCMELPPIDLSNLFQYAVTRLPCKSAEDSPSKEICFTYYKDFVRCEIELSGGHPLGGAVTVGGEGQDETWALYWALDEVRKRNE